MFLNETGSTCGKRAASLKTPIIHRTRFRPRTTMIAAAISVGIVAGSGLSVVHAQIDMIDEETAIFLAQRAAPSGPDQGRGPPPREAVAACANRALESVCSFSGRDGQKIEGTCRSPEADVPEVCVPSETPHKG